MEFGVERMIFVELPLVENFMADLRGVTLDQYVEDKVLWKNSSTGDFTVKLAFDVCQLIESLLKGYSISNCGIYSPRKMLLCSYGGYCWIDCQLW